MIAAALLSVVSMGVLIAVQVTQDVQTLMTQSLRERIAQHALTSLELAVLWSTFAALLYLLSKWMSRRARAGGSQ
jgi:ABC-type Fe3+ transport system permease subunit